eukprot:4675578-Pleurochrysis_carterae.AAC.1
MPWGEGWESSAASWNPASFGLRAQRGICSRHAMPSNELPYCRTHGSCPQDAHVSLSSSLARLRDALELGDLVVQPLVLR